MRSNSSWVIKTLINQRVVKVICWNSHLFLLSIYTMKEISLLCAYWTYFLKRGFNFQDFEINLYSLLHLFPQKNHQTYSWALALPIVWQEYIIKLHSEIASSVSGGIFQHVRIQKANNMNIDYLYFNVPNSLHSFLFYHNWYFCFQQKLIHIGFSNR